VGFTLLPSALALILLLPGLCSGRQCPNQARYMA
jgi:hypothetical protein